MLPKPRKPTELRWRPKWEDLTDADRKQFELWVKEIEVSLTIPIAEPQLVGSRAFGNNEINSDYDVVFVPFEDEASCDLSLANSISKKINETNGLKINIGIGPDARKLVCYSFADHKFYGKTWGEVINKKSRYNSHAKTFQLYDV